MLAVGRVAPADSNAEAAEAAMRGDVTLVAGHARRAAIAAVPLRVL